MNFIHICQNFTIWHVVLLEIWHVLHFCTDGFPRVSRVRRRQYDPYQRVALGGFSTPCVGSTQRRWLPHPTNLWGVRVRALWRSPLQSDRHRTATPGPRRLVRLEFYLWGFITHEAVESAALRVRTDFCDHNPTVVALSPFGLFPAVSPYDPAWLDHMDHLRELLSLAEPLDVT
jgi:hypothetical protein